MSDKLNPGAEHRPTSIEAPTGNDALSMVELETVLATDREGLPRGYHMRADRHYVEQLASPSAALPVRMVPVSQIDSDGTLARNDLRPLVESVRLYGIAIHYWSDVRIRDTQSSLAGSAWRSPKLWGSQPCPASCTTWTRSRPPRWKPPTI